MLNRVHSYYHHIKDFNNSTRHLTRIERSIYLDAIHLYYDIEQPLPTDDIPRLERKLLCNTDDEKKALSYILREFFEATDAGFYHERCEIELDKYRANTSAKARAGKASAAARKKKSATRRKQKGTGVEQVLDECGTGEQLTSNHKPVTSNHNNNDVPPEHLPESVVVSYSQILDLYHTILPELPRMLKLTPARKGQINQRHTQDLKTLEKWEEFFIAVSRSDFLMGRRPGTGDKPPFMADLEWITKQGNFAKIAEGRYHRG